MFTLLVSCDASLVSAILNTGLFAVLTAALVIVILREQFSLFLSLFAGLLAGVIWCGGYGFLVWQPTQQYNNAVGEMRLELTEYAESKESYGIGYGILTEFNGTPCRLNVKVYLQDGSPSYAPGDVLLFRGKLRVSEREVRSNLIQEGIFLTVSQQTEERYLPGEAMTPMRYARVLSRKITDTTLQLIPGDEGALLAALLSGDRKHFSPEFDRALTTSGTRHITAVSGLHVTILAGILMSLLGKKHGLLAAVPLSLLYAAIVGFSPSVVRATVLLIFWSIAFWLKQEKDSLTAFAAGLLLLLLINPFCCVSAGLLLSFGATLGLILLSSGLNEPLIDRIKTIKQKPLKKLLWYASGTITATMAATLFTMPLTILFFDTVPLLSLISNLLILWVLSFTMMFGILTLLLYGLIPWTGAFLAKHLLIWPLRWCVFVIRTIGNMRWASTDAKNIWILLSCLAILCIALLWRGKHLPGKSVLIVIIALVCITALFTFGDRMAFGHIEIQNAGGQPIILLRGDGISLINTGANPKTATETVQTAMERWNCQGLNTVVCTSETFRTQSGLAAVLHDIPVDTILLPGSSQPVSAAYREYPVRQYMTSGTVEISGYRLELFETQSDAYAFRLLGEELSLLSLCGVKPSSVSALLKQYDLSADLLLLDDQAAEDWQLLYTICQAVQPKQIILTTNGYSEHGESFSGIPLTMLQRETISLRFKR